MLKARSLTCQESERSHHTPPPLGTCACTGRRCALFRVSHAWLPLISQASPPNFIRGSGHTSLPLFVLCQDSGAANQIFNSADHLGNLAIDCHDIIAYKIAFTIQILVLQCDQTLYEILRGGLARLGCLMMGNYL